MSSGVRLIRKRAKKEAFSVTRTPQFKGGNVQESSLSATELLRSQRAPRSGFRSMGIEYYSVFARGRGGAFQLSVYTGPAPV